MVFRCFNCYPVIILIAARIVAAKLTFIEVAIRDYSKGLSLPIEPLLRYNAEQTTPTCQLDILNDFPELQPIFLYKDNLIQPDRTNGSVTLKQNEVLTAVCSGKDNFVDIDTYNPMSVINTEKEEKTCDKQKRSIVNITCVVDKTFIFQGVATQFNKIKCDQYPWFTMDRTEHKCYSDNNITRFGYYIHKKLYLLYEVCFDAKTLSTVYTKHTLRPSNYYFQNLTKAPYVGEVMYGNSKVKDLFSAKNQISILDHELGEEEHTRYLSNKQFLTRAHLTPRADFSMINYQRATFTYMNTAPQWFSVNKDEWLAIEKALRRRISTHNNEVIIYSGTFGLSTLLNKQSAPTHIYLGKGQNGTQIMPVPLYFYKLIYDPINNTALAIVLINAPFLSPIGLRMLHFCNDVCPNKAINNNNDSNKINWIKWPHKNRNKIFCCSFHEFYKIVDHVQLHVRDLFV